MTTYDLLVVGAGPAGINGALAARRYGLKVGVIDEAPRAGGQIYRAPCYVVRPDDLEANPDLARGEALRAALDTSGAELFFGHKAWFAAPEWRLSTVGPSGPTFLSARALLLATGTTERVVPAPGSTLPGVIGLAAATILLKAHAVVPAGPTVIAGVGPLLYAVAAGMRKLGGEVAAVIDQARPSEWAAALPRLLSRPDLLRRGFGWAADLMRAGVPIRFGSALEAIHGDGETGVREVTVARLVRDRSFGSARHAETIRARSVAIGHGLAPATEFARLLGVGHSYRAERGGWTPDVAADGSTRIAGVYIAGDCAGISGAAAAEEAGTLTGLAVARDLGALSGERFDEVSRPVVSGLKRAQRFGWAMSDLMRLRPALVHAMTPATVVCRCEDVTRAAIDAAVAAGVVHVNQLKSMTRCGMGPCQGRMCADVAGELVARGRPRAEAGQWTARAPLRPIPLEAMLGAFTYDDIPKPPPLPA